MVPKKENIGPEDVIDLRFFDFSKNNAKDFISKIIIIGIVVIVIFPLIGDYGNLLFPIGRDIILRVTVEVVGALFILLIYLDRSYLPKSSIILWLYFVFWLISGITIIFSTQPQFSFWGNIFRGQGFFSQTHVFLLFLIIVGFVKYTEQWKKIIWLSVAVGTVVSLVAFFEYVVNQGEAQGTLNNPNFLGMYLLFPVFLTVFLILNKENLKWRIILISALILELIAAYLSKSRGTWAGLIVGFTCVIVVYKLLPFFYKLFFYKLSKQKKIVISVLLLVGLVTTIGLFQKEINAVQSFIKDPKAERIESRLVDWFRLEYYQAAVRGIMEKPLTGFGLENFTVAFDKHYRGVLDDQGWENQWSDKAHNIFLEVGVATGLFGLAVYLGMWITTFTLLIKKIIAYESKRQLDNQYWMAIGLLSVFSAYLTNNQLTIESTTNMAYSAVFLALAVFLINSEVANKRNERALFNKLWAKGEKIRFVILAVGLFMMVIIVNNKYNIPEITANYRLNEGERYFTQMDYLNGFYKFEESLLLENSAVSPYLRYRYGIMAILYRDNSLIFGVEIDRQTIQRALELQNENAQNEWSVFTRNWILAGKLSNILLENNNNPTERIHLKNQADDYFQKALNLSPNHGVIYLEWAKTDIIMGDYLLAEQKISRAENINPKNGYVWWLRALIAIRTGRNKEATDFITQAQRLGYDIYSPLSIAEMGAIYDQMQDWNGSVSVYSVMTQLHPWDINGYLKLTTAYSNLKENEKALEILEQALPKANAYYQALIKKRIAEINRQSE